MNGLLEIKNPQRISLPGTIKPDVDFTAKFKDAYFFGRYNKMMYII